MGKIKVTLPLILSAFLFSLFILILILATIGFQNSNSGQSENSNPSRNFNQKLEEDSHSITSCSVAMAFLPSPRSQKQWIYPHGNSTKVEVLCDFQVDGGGWTVIQKRSSGPQNDFNRTWLDYVEGFGCLSGNFWLGLENIHTLTKNGDQELQIELADFEGEERWAKYSSFSISDASDFYRLNVSGFSRDSTAGDSMTNPKVASVNNGMRFSTKDKDNDLSDGNCAETRGGAGWWFNSCGTVSLLNGPYREKGESFPYSKAIFWSTWKGIKYSLAKTEMKIRKRNPNSHRT